MTDDSYSDRAVPEGSLSDLGETSGDGSGRARRSGDRRGRDVWRRDEIDSPCINVCVIHPTERICAGCMRTIDEIAGWSTMGQDARDRVKSELAARAPRLKKRRGGREARLRRGGEVDPER